MVYGVIALIQLLKPSHIIFLDYKGRNEGEKKLQLKFKVKELKLVKEVLKFKFQSIQLALCKLLL